MENTIEKARFNEKRLFFDAGHTRSYDFRKEQLLKLQSAIHQYADQIKEALYSDLHKSAMEAYMTETSVIDVEISHSLKNLRAWMKPQKQTVPIALEPSSCSIHYEPKGVVLIIAPWNYPVMLSLSPLIGAIAAGNAVILKPSEEAPASARVIEKIIESCFDPDYISVVQGLGHEVVPKLMDEHTFNHVFFTGSTAVGRIIAKQASEKLTSTTLELGGKSPAVIDSTADLKVSARRIVWGKLMNAGQTCVSPDYILVEENIKDKLVKELVNAIESSYGSNPENSEDYPRMINEKQFDRVSGYLKNGRVLYGGNTNRELKYIQPTLVDQVDLDAPIMQEEIFGPVLPILTFSSNHEIRQIINRNRYPLACYYFGSDGERENLVMNQTEFGGGCVNNTVVHLGNPDLPFGGVQYSGSGQYHGWHGFECFSHKKSIVKTGTWFDPPMKYAPFTESKFKLLKNILKIS
jgi:aldehyde dehydrogenase (NAD+)